MWERFLATIAKKKPSMETPPAVRKALKSVLTVDDGRGFVIKIKQQRLVVPLRIVSQSYRRPTLLHT
jgi:hypothetical protein